MKDSDDASALVVGMGNVPIEERMHPVIARFRNGLREQDQRLLDELYIEAEDNINTVLKSVDFVTDYEKTLFALLLHLLKKVYLQEEENRNGEF